MRRLSTLLCFFSGLFLSASASGLGLKDAEALWQKHSRELHLAGAAVAGAAAELQMADRRPNPELALNIASISPQSGLGSGHPKDKRMDNILRIEQLIERGGKRELRVRSASARLAAAGLEREDIRRQQRGELRRAYFDLLLAQEKHVQALAAAELYERSLQAANLRLKAGDVAPVDVARLTIDKSRADNEARQALAELEQAREELAYLIGRENEAQTLVATDPWPALITGDLPRPRLEQRPDLRASNERLSAAEAERDLARALKTRDVSIGVQMEHNLQNAPTNSYGVGITIPLFAWHAHEGEIARAESELDSARLQYEKQQAQALGQLAQARSALLAARDRLQRLSGGMLVDAERVARAAELAYAKGAMNLMDLLDARRTLRQLRIEAATAQADYAKARSDWELQAEYMTEQENKEKTTP